MRVHESVTVLVIVTLLAACRCDGRDDRRGGREPDGEETLPAWRPGELELHFISTGVGENAFYRFPDGTTWVNDCGDYVSDPHEVPPVPSDMRLGGEWVARYLHRLGVGPRIDYLTISHAHTDHAGDPGQRTVRAADGRPVCGAALLMEHFDFDIFSDCDWPETNVYHLADASYRMMREAAEAAARTKGLKIVPCRVGASDQFGLRHDPQGRYAGKFRVRNLCSNARAWTGRGEEVRDFGAGERAINPNPLSMGFRIDYGPFSFYTGGDVSGCLKGEDYEAFVARSCGPVTIAKANHHSDQDAMSEATVRALRPQAWVSVVWHKDDITDVVMKRMLTGVRQAESRRFFPTAVAPTSRALTRNCAWWENVARPGHVVIKVAPDGTDWCVYVLDSADERMRVIEKWRPGRTDPASAATHPVVMMRFSSAQTRTLEEWRQTANAFADNPGCCDEVWFSTGESFPSVDWHRQNAARLGVAAKDMRKLGVGVSLQFEATIGHGDDFPTEEERRIFEKPWTGWTGPDGTECRYCNCPRQPDFLKRLAEVGEIYGSISPSVVWIDDDLRDRGHYPVSGAEGPGCWCSKCVTDFALEDGKPWTRETLRAAHEKDAGVRARWQDFTARSLAAVACTIARAFRKVSPKTRIGLQTGTNRNRMTEVVIRALAVEMGEKSCVRMGGGAYYDLSPFAQIAKSYEMVANRARLELEDVVGNWCTEIESYPRAYGSRSVRSIALEAFSSIGWGFDTASLFVMDRRSETDEFYSKYLLRPLADVTAFLNAYCAANRGTAPAGFKCPFKPSDARYLAGIPVLPGRGVSWGDFSAEREELPGLGAIWGEFRNDLVPDYDKTPSAKIQSVRDRLSGAAPLKLVSPFIGLVLPRIAERGDIRTIGLIGARLDPQYDIGMEIATTHTRVRWHELGRPAVELPLKVTSGRSLVTIPSIGVWGVGYLELND